MSKLIFLKLGGSLITDKHQPQTAQVAILDRLAPEIQSWRQNNPETPLVLGHGSGSFGHIPAQQYGTRKGVTSSKGWQGFAKVWFEASSLNRIVMAALQQAGIPAMAFPASGGAITADGRVTGWDLTPLTTALKNGILPVVFGDVVFDTVRGGTILSTEDIFGYLAQALRPQKILLAGVDDGVWADFPACTRLIPEITPHNYADVVQAIGGSAATDVTGGMASKVRQMLELTSANPGLEVVIFNGNHPKNLILALKGQRIGTKIWNPTS